MINAPYEKEFVFNDGRRAKNLLELSAIIDLISQQDFEIFVNPRKNDFANWIEYVLMDKQLASSLRSTILLDKTKELLNNKLVAENTSEPPINGAGNQYKKSLFNIFKHNPNTVVQISTSIQKLPEPEHKKELEYHFDAGQAEHHVIQKIPEQKIPENTSANKLADISVDKPADKTKNVSKKEKNDNTIKRWYEFKKQERESRKHKTSESTSESNSGSNDTPGNSGVDSGSGNILWILLYGALIILIIALIVYKFVLRL